MSGRSRVASPLLALLSLLAGCRVVAGYGTASDVGVTPADHRVDRRSGDRAIPIEDLSRRDMAPEQDTQPPCPSTKPEANNSEICATEGQQCGFGSGPECGSVWECYQGTWALVGSETACLPLTGGCDKTQPTGFCTENRIPCRYGAIVCRCLVVCSGVQPPPGQTHSWACSLPQTLACPPGPGPPPDADACTKDGLFCRYGECVNASEAECVGGKWVVRTIQPPP